MKITNRDRERAAALAREIVIYSAGVPWEKATSEERIRAEDVARHWALPREKQHLRELRRAKGRTIGWLRYDPDGQSFGSSFPETLADVKRDHNVRSGEDRIARVVLIPKPKRRNRR